MPTEKEVLEGVLVEALNFTTEEVAALYDAEGLKDSAKQTILDKRAAVVQAEKAQAKKGREEQLMRGRKEGGKKWEDFLKGEGVELGDLTGESEEAFAKVKEHFAALKTPASVADTDEAKIKNSEIFRKREKELLGQVAAKDAEWSAKWTERDAKEARERTLSVVKDQAIARFKARNPILPKDEVKAKNLMRLLNQDLEALDYELSEDGKSVEVIKDKDGKRVETPQGNAVKFDPFVDEIADRYFEFAASTERSSVGDPTKGSKPSNGAGYTGKKPANRAQLADAYLKLSDDQTMKPDEKKAAMEQLKAWEKEMATV